MSKKVPKKSVIETTIKKAVEAINGECVATFHADELLLEMAQVANIRDYRIIVWTDDCGRIPHFHVVKGKNPGNPEVDACIKIYPAEYYPHGGHTDKLPKNIIRLMIVLFRSIDPRPKTPGWTYWKTLINAWNLNNGREQIDIDTPMPDYSKLNYATTEDGCDSPFAIGRIFLLLRHRFRLRGHVRADQSRVTPRASIPAVPAVFHLAVHCNSTGDSSRPLKMAAFSRIERIKYVK